MIVYLVFYLLNLITLGLNIIADKLLKQRWNLWLGYGLPVLGIMLLLWRFFGFHYYGDFNKAYYPAGNLILHNPSGLYYSSHGAACFGFVNIPILALFFTPFAAFDKPTARVLFSIVGGLAVFTSCYLLVRLTKVSGWQKIALLELFAISGPLYYSIQLGNTTHIVLLLLLAAFFCIQAGREFLLGVLLGFAASIKIPLFLFGIYFLMRGRWRVVAGFCGILLALGGLSVLLFGVDLHLSWFHECIQPFSGRPLSGFNIQSVDGFLVRLLTNSSINQWHLIEVGWGYKVTRYALLSLLVGGTIWVCWRSHPPATVEVQNLEFSIVLCLSLVISPIAWTHYYLFLLLPLSLYLCNRLAVPRKRPWLSSIVLSTLLISPPVVLFVPANPVARLLTQKLLISHYFFGGILLLGVLLAARWNASHLNNTNKIKDLPYENLN